MYRRVRTRKRCYQVMSNLENFSESCASGKHNRHMSTFLGSKAVFEAGRSSSETDIVILACYAADALERLKANDKSWLPKLKDLADHLLPSTLESRPSTSTALISTAQVLALDSALNTSGLSRVERTNVNQILSQVKEVRGSLLKMVSLGVATDEVELLRLFCLEYARAIQASRGQLYTSLTKTSPFFRAGLC